MLRKSTWLPPDPAAVRALSSAKLQESDDADDLVTLFCDGKRVAEFTVPRGRGESFLLDCGLERQ